MRVLIKAVILSHEGSNTCHLFHHRNHAAASEEAVECGKEISDITGELPLTTEEYSLPWHEDVLENNHALAVTNAVIGTQRFVPYRLLGTGTSDFRVRRDKSNALGIKWGNKGYGIVLIFLSVSAGWNDKGFIGAWR